MKIEVGKKYVDEVGDVIHIYFKDKHPTHPFVGRVYSADSMSYSDFALSYNEEGALSEYFTGNESQANIVKDA